MAYWGIYLILSRNERTPQTICSATVPRSEKDLRQLRPWVLNVIFAWDKSMENC